MHRHKVVRRGDYYNRLISEVRLKKSMLWIAERIYKSYVKWATLMHVNGHNRSSAGRSDPISDRQSSETGCGNGVIIA